MTVLLGSAAVVFAVVGLIYTVSSRRAPGNVLRGPEGSSSVIPDVRQLHLSQGAGQRVISPALRGLSEWVRRISPQGRVDSLHSQIELAGLTNRFPVELALLAKFALAAVAIVAWLLTPLREAPYAILLAVLSTFIAFFLPDYVIPADSRADLFNIQIQILPLFHFPFPIS